MSYLDIRWCNVLPKIVSWTWHTWLIWQQLFFLQKPWVLSLLLLCPSLPGSLSICLLFLPTVHGTARCRPSPPSPLPPRSGHCTCYLLAGIDTGLAGRNVSRSCWVGWKCCLSSSFSPLQKAEMGERLGRRAGGPARTDGRTEERKEPQEKALLQKKQWCRVRHDFLGPSLPWTHSAVSISVGLNALYLV